MRQLSNWSLSSWRRKEALQLPLYQSLAEVDSIQSILSELPPLVTPDEIEKLKSQLAKAAEGNNFLIQTGDCAESFKDCSAHITQKKADHLLKLGDIFVSKTKRPVLHVGRIAGQYTKPRSAIFESYHHQKIPSYLGDMVNSPIAELSKREPNPLLMLKGYGCALSVIKKLKDHHVSSAKNKKIYTSHEALLLFYEQALTKYDSHLDNWYDLSTHFPWLGMRTAFKSPAHVEYLRGIANPIAIKIGPDVNQDQLIDLIKLLDPRQIPGRLTLIHRLGSNKVHECLPKIIAAVAKTRRKVLWCCDPMHGNTEMIASDLKIRRVEKICEEITHSFDVHKKNGTHLGGIHLEATHEHVIECISDSDCYSEKMIRSHYKSLLDPRLNHLQSLKVMHLTAKFYAESYSALHPSSIV